MRKKTNLLITIVITAVIVFSFCIRGGTKNMVINKDKISAEHVEIAGGGWYNSFIINFSNMIYEEKDKTITIPIFQGIKGDVYYKDFREYCLRQKYLKPRVRESGFIVKCKKGEVKKTFVEFLNFYRSNILKDVDFNDKSNFDADENGWTVFFKFYVDGIPCVMNIQIDAAKRIDRKKLNSVYDIMVNEDMAYPSFAYSFDINSEVTPW